MSLKFRKLLVANRGEIALRILRTAKELGIKTVAVHSEADKNALHTREADEAYCVGSAESAQSYLKVDAILEAARHLKADAIHPGYGFLSENAGFARAVEKAGLCFVGPSSAAIEQMGDKVVARKTVEAFKVPTVPGTEGHTEIESALKAIEDLKKKRPEFRYPLLIKAAGGGGGKGMRIVRKDEELKDSLERARSESLKAFNNPMIFVERYVERPRHIEVQVLGDGERVVHLFERECSLQRRHQKVVEEALSPSLSDELRAKIHEAGIRAAQSVKYSSAGTVEFIVSENDEFFFLEMNTRIQVEHPVTEWITGEDLIRHQMEIASGKKIPPSFDHLKPKGHSVEVRLYAEDADSGFLPQPGQLHYLRFPSWTGVRVDSSVESPTEISSFYDPMIAKISAWAPDRAQALERMRLFLEKTRVEGLVTNRAFLLEILKSEFFKKGRYHTQILEDKSWRINPPVPNEIAAALCLKDYLEQNLDFEDRRLSSWQEGMHRNALAP